MHFRFSRRSVFVYWTFGPIDTLTKEKKINNHQQKVKYTFSESTLFVWPLVVFVVVVVAVVVFVVSVSVCRSAVVVDFIIIVCRCGRRRLSFLYYTFVRFFCSYALYFCSFSFASECMTTYRTYFYKTHTHTLFHFFLSPVCARGPLSLSANWLWFFCFCILWSLIRKEVNNTETTHEKKTKIKKK